MTIALIPPDMKYPDTYHVRGNRCNCHPETCCCNDWVVHGPNGERHSSHYQYEVAELVAEALNEKLNKGE